MSDLERNFKPNNETPEHGLKFIAKDLLSKGAIFSRLKLTGFVCMLAVLVISISALLPTAYAAWYNDNAEVSELSVGPAARTAPAPAEPGEFEELVSVLSDSTFEYIVYVDGKEAGSIDSIEKLNDILHGFISEYSTENTVHAEIKETVSTKCIYSESYSESQEYLLRKALDPENEESECALTVTTVDRETVGETIPYQTAKFEATDLDEGTTEIRQAGIDGYVTKTVTTTKVNGQETDSEISDVREIVKSEAELIAVGTRPLTASKGFYIWPTEGILTSDFGPRNVTIGSRFHKGIDIVGAYCQEIRAADGGTVTYSGVMSGFGNVIFITHDNGDVTVYAHNTELLVGVGEKVMQGQTISLMGNTGTSSAIHCHFELRVGGTQIDPLPYLR